MILKNCLALFGAVAAAHGVAAQLDVDSASALGLIPKELKQRLQYCDSGSKPDFKSDRPCDLEKAEDARLFQEAGLDPALESDRHNATKLAAYRKGVEASTFRTNALNCCLECKKLHKVHNYAQDKYWRSFYDDAKLKAWYSMVDSYVPGKNSTAPPVLWNYLQGRSGSDAPSSDLENQALNVTEQKLDSYCPDLSASKAKDRTLSAMAKTFVIFPGRCMDFYVKAEASVTALGNSEKFPKNVTVSASDEVFANQIVICPVVVVNGTEGREAWSAPARVQGVSIKVSAQAAAHLTQEAACSSCAAAGTVAHIPATFPDFEASFTGGASHKVLDNLRISGNSGASARPSGGAATPASKEGSASGPASEQETLADRGPTVDIDNGADEAAWC